MKTRSTQTNAVISCSSSAIIVAILACTTAGCGSGKLEVDESGPETATSLTATDELTGASSADQANDKEAAVRREKAVPTTDGNSGTEPQAVSTENVAPAAVPAEATEPNNSTPDRSTEIDASAKRPLGTKLPKDLLDGSQLTPLNPQKTVLLDLPGKRILLRAKVCLTEGLLEMLLCPHQTKEHESILSTEAQAFTVHSGLLALGCKEGKAARYDSETEAYTPASGQIIDVFLHWVDVDGKLRRERAQNWVRGSRHVYYQAEFKTLPTDLKLVPDGNLRYDDVNQYLFWYGPMTDQERDECLKMSSDEKFKEAIRKFHKDGQEKPMTADWVFVGSGFYEDGDSGRQYLAEGGYMICVANFAMAMLDVSIPSDSNGTESLTYEAATERIPPRESEVLIELVPRPEKEPTDKPAAPAADKAE
ncbi:MAG: hypothetical protein HQ518_13475 [Rhodopirellula sp.]|nr:hypothetical protein [Rhodopirellula sp.]